MFNSTTGHPNAVLVIHNHEIKMLSFTCVPVSFFFGWFGSDLNQSEGGLRCEFQMLTGLELLIRLCCDRPVNI